jgi:hypothetical protein
MPPLDHSKSAPYHFEEDVIIICVDVEAWERSSSIITEVGIATLDTRELHDLPPGAEGENWRKTIRARHFRIREHMMYENREFVQGAADRFEKDFGESEIINLKDAPRIIAECFKEPFSKPPTDAENAAPWKQIANSSQDDDQRAPEKRNIIFLGHYPNVDIQYLRKLGYDPFNLSNLLETMDTASLYRAHKKEQNPRCLSHILAEFDLVGWNLHNAGNDAVYTLWIMLATAVKEASMRAEESESGDEGDEEEKTNENTGVSEKKVEPNVLEFVVPEEYRIW